MRILLFTGKGGVGKTTTAAATGVHCARRGVKTLVVSTDASHSLADAFGVPVGAEPTEVESGLFGQQVDGRSRLDRSWAGVHDYLLQVLDAVGMDPLAAQELTALPGVDDVLALLEVRDQAQNGPWDAVLVDCAPTAETLRLLALPEVLTWALGRLLPGDRRMLRALRPAIGRGGLPVPGDAVLEGVQRLSDELAEVREVLMAPGTSVRLVLTPESVVLAEARRTLTSLALLGYPVDGVVANRVVPAGDDPWRAGWAAAQLQVLREAEASFAPVPVLRSAYAGAEPVGADALAALAAELYDDAAIDPLTRPGGARSLVVERDGDELVLLLGLPLADRRDVDLVRRGDDLVVTVGSCRRILSLPSALRRCVVVGAALRDDVLRVRFEPDPAVWRPL